MSWRLTAAYIGMLLAAGTVVVVAITGLLNTALSTLGVWMSAGGGVIAAISGGLVGVVGSIATVVSGRERSAARSNTTGMSAAARLLPRTAGEEWLAEARSSLFEAPPQARRAIARSYLLAAPQVFVAAWAGALTGQLRTARDAWMPGEKK